MANRGKRKGSKNSFQKAKFSSHFQRADKNKQRNKLKDEMQKEIQRLKVLAFQEGKTKKHRHVWRIEGQTQTPPGTFISVKRQKCQLCETKRIKQYDINAKGLQSHYRSNNHRASQEKI